VTISGNKLVLARGLTAADDGAQQWSVAATQNGVTISGVIPVQVTSSPLSPDGTQVAPGSGLSIYTKDGTWSFGAFAVDGINAAVLLNGASAQGFYGHLLVVANGGQLYVLGVTVWWVWQGGQFVQSSQSIPSPVYPIAITLTPASSMLPNNSPAGTVIATATVTMSDGSQFAGTLSTSDANFFAISGNTIVTARALTAADDGTHTTVITAHQGGYSLSAGLSI
jgi:hypothetical protein